MSANRPPGLRHNRPLQGMLLWLAALWGLTAIRPLYPRDWLLENLLVFICVGLLAATYRRFTFSNRSYALFTVYLSLHLVGAHYTYSEVPIGFWVQDALALSRNHYDRLVHFAFGLFIAYPFREILLRAAGLRRSWSYLMPVLVVLGFSGFYESLEALTAMIVSPELGAAYLGTQGDEWDAAKDTVLAMIGAMVAMGLTWWGQRRQRPADPPSGQGPARAPTIRP